MAIVRLLLVVFVLAGCQKASENDAQNTQKKDEAVKQNNKTETVNIQEPPAPPTETVAVEPQPGPPIVVDVPVPVEVLPGYAGFPRTFGSGGPGRKIRKCLGPECPGFISLIEDCGGFVDLAEECPGFVTASKD